MFGFIGLFLMLRVDWLLSCRCGWDLVNLSCGGMLMVNLGFCCWYGLRWVEVIMMV